MKKLSKKIIGVVLIIIILLQGNLVFATSVNSLKNEINNESNKIDQNDKEKDKLKKEKEKITEEKKKVNGEIEELTHKIVDCEAEVNELDTKIKDLSSQIAKLNEDLKGAEKDYTDSKKLLEKRLVAVQESGDTTYLDFLLSSNSFVDLISNYYLVTELASYDAEMLAQLEEKQKVIKNGKAELENKKKEIDTAKASKQAASVKLKNAKGEKNQKVANLSEEEKKMQEKIDQLIKDNKEIDAKIKRAQEAIKKAEQQNKNKGSSNNKHHNNGGGTSNPSKSGFIYPVPKNYSTITTGLYYSSGRYHGAVDFGSGGINGQPVYAVADGYVVTSENLGNRSYGNYIIIAHYNGLYTLYAHGQNGSRTVSEGQTVKQGQQIMRVGTTGNSTGPHLHFEVRTSPGTYSCRVDPRAYLP